MSINHSPTYRVRVIRRSLKDGVNFSFFTSNVSNMSNTGIAYICSSHKLMRKWRVYIEIKAYYLEKILNLELNLVASNNMDDNKQVGCCYKPAGFLQCDKDIVSNAVPKHPVSNQSDREVAQGNNNISKNHSFPHGSLGRLLRSGGNCCLDLQHHIVTSIGKCYVTQGAKEVEDSSSCGRSCVCILHIWLDTLMNRSCPGNSWVTADWIWTINIPQGM